MSNVESESRKYAYCPYGYRRSVYRALLAFNGEFFDCLAQGYPLGSGYRLFDPALRRFLSADQLSPFGPGGINAYAYCKGDPVNKLDPSGRESFLASVLPTGLLKKLRIMSKTGLTKQAKDLGLDVVEVKSHARMLERPGASIKVLSNDRPYTITRGESRYKLSIDPGTLAPGTLDLARIQLARLHGQLTSSQFHVRALTSRLEVSEQRLDVFQKRLWAAEAELDRLRTHGGTWV